MAPRVVEVTEFGAGTELVAHGGTGEFYIETPVDEPDDDGLALALAEAARRGLVLIEAEEMGEFEQIDGDAMKLWLTPAEPVEVEGWL